MSDKCGLCGRESPTVKPRGPMNIPCCNRVVCQNRAQFATEAKIK